LTRVQISEHVWVNISRRSLCDNCVADVCLKRTEESIEQCDLFKSSYIAFKRCSQCGEIYELFSNFKSLNYEMCPICNERVKAIPVIQASEALSSHC
jgi:hypothetical protein